LIIQVDDPGDPRLADYIGLRDRRTPDGVVIVEGIVAVGQLVTSGYPIRSLLVLRSQLPRVEPLVAGRDLPVYLAEPEVLSATVGFNLHRGVVAAADRLPVPAAEAVWRNARTVAVLEGLNDHENLGALFRNAAAFGVDGVLLSPSCADPLYRRSVRVSLGHVLHVPFAWFPSWPADLGRLRAGGFEVVALTPSADAEPIDGVAFVDRVALLLGTEGPGLSAAALAAADRRVRIPMRTGVDSVNVATAAAIAFYARQVARR